MTMACRATRKFSRKKRGCSPNSSDHQGHGPMRHQGPRGPTQCHQLRLPIPIHTHRLTLTRPQVPMHPLQRSRNKAQACPGHTLPSSIVPNVAIQATRSRTEGLASRVGEGLHLKITLLLPLPFTQTTKCPYTLAHGRETGPCAFNQGTLGLGASCVVNAEVLDVLGSSWTKICVPCAMA